MPTTRTTDDLIAEINKRGWTVLNLFQLGKSQPKMSWRCNLQRWTANGASENYFSEFADAYTMEDALAAALANTLGRKDIVDNGKRVAQTTTLSAGQTAKIIKAIDRMIFAVEDHGTRSTG